MSAIIVLAGPAAADGGGPQECEVHPPGNFWPTYTVTDAEPDGSFILDGDAIWGPEWEVWYVCIKSGSQQFGNEKHSDAFYADGVYDNGCYQIEGIGTRFVRVSNVGDCQDISHIDVGKRRTPTTTTTAPTTTTSTVPDSTTTTVPDSTTTTVPDSTTTTVPDSTTTTVPDSTTTTVPEVMALVFVTVDGTCEVDDDKGVGEITVTVSVDDAATVVIRDGDGSVVDSVTRDAVISVPEGDTYTWEATPNDGFEFADDFVSIGEVEIETCTPDEVKDLEVLPFTGIETDALAVIAAVLSTLGLLVVLAVRRVEE